MEYSLRTEGDESLYSKSTSWDFSEPPESSDLVEKALLDLMIREGGIGLAANQMGLMSRVFAMNINVQISGTRFFYNPSVLVAGEDQVIMEEGCLSFPGLRLRVRRPQMIVATWQDGGGETHTEKLTGLAARCYQHEVDHLDGWCFTDRVSRLTLGMARKRRQKRERNQ